MAYNFAVVDSPIQLGTAARLLELWAELYREGAFCPFLPFISWQAADDLVGVAKAADRLARDGLTESLAISNQAFGPLADPLAIDFGVHRWLSSEREEAYSDWLAWILTQIADPRRILKLFGVQDENLLEECALEEPKIKRESNTDVGRPDLVVWFGNRLLVVIEIKTKWFDEIGVNAQLIGYAKWAKDQRQPSRRFFVPVEFASFDPPAGFKSLPWRELALRLRKLALEWIQESTMGRLNGSYLVSAAMTLAFCGAVEQNLLRFSKTPKLFRALASAEYLEDWRARKGV
jgi:hypothetical protein